jgi:carbamoyl-phosphate synthase large subunit
VLVRPSFVLGGRAMQIVYSDAELSHYMRSPSRPRPNARCWWTNFWKTPPRWTWIASPTSATSKIPNEGTIVIGGMLEHIEFAGVHSGDAAMVLPPHTLSKKVIETIREYTHAMARELKVIGLMNVQYAVKGDTVYVLEVNPRASRTVPFVSKAIGVPLAKLAAKVMAGKNAEGTRVHRGNLAEILGGEGIRFPVQPLSRPGHFALAGNAFHRRSHGPRRRPGHRLRQIADGRGRRCRSAGKFSSASATRTKAKVAEVAKQFAELGFELVATGGTAAVLEKAGLKVRAFSSCRRPAQRD